MTWTLIAADCVEAMRGMEPSSIDAVVTDPPYHLSFMGKDWDRKDDHRPWATEALRVLKPGGHLLSFGGTRTYHRLVCALEDAGFEIRDCLAWLYGSGFPKSLDVSKAIDKAAGAAREVVGEKVYGNGETRPRGADETHHEGYRRPWREADPQRSERLTAPATPDAERWQGWGTALKPAFEPIVLARKPLSGTVAENVLRHGVGALNVDGTRIETDGRPLIESASEPSVSAYGDGLNGSRAVGQTQVGRWPANVLLDADAAAAVGPESRFFYTAKTSRSERENGVAQYGDIPLKERDAIVEPLAAGANLSKQDEADREFRSTRNNHPTVKPVDLMQWLCRLITPPQGVILDPFTGSGSTGIAALREGFSFIGIEREPDYVEIARARIIGDAPLFNVSAEV